MIPFEQDNLKAYALLLRIEIVLRECLRKSLESEFGAQWQKKLPGELLTKIKKAQTEENKPQYDFIRLGPLYYLTFGELLSLLQQKTGRPVAEKLGGDCILKQLENLFAPRNAICHSRPVSSVGLKTIETLYAQIETALTMEKMSIFMAKPDTGMRQDDAARTLKPFLQQVLCDLTSFPLAFTIPESYQTATIQFWWAEDSLAGFNCFCVESAIALISEYSKLSKGLGAAWNRQKFCEDRNMKKQIQDAIIELEKVPL
jgi:hypothetical protein